MATNNTDQQKYLRLEGLKTFWGKIKDHVTIENNKLKTSLRGGNDTDTLKSLRDSIDSMTGDSGAMNNAIDTAIGKLDVEDSAIDGQYVSSVSETDGKIAVTRVKLPTYSVSENSAFITVTPTPLDDGGKSFAITTSDIASETALTKLTQDVRALDTKDTGRVSKLEKQVAALASATHFRGAVESKESITDPAEGDIVVETKTGKEFIYSNSAWVELGDTTAEQGRISALETTVYTEGTGLVDKVAALETAVGGSTVVNSFGGQSGNISVDTAATGAGKVKFTMVDKKLTATVDIGATATQGAKADSAVQSGKGVAGNHTTTTVEKDENNKALNIKVDVATVTNYTTDSTDIPTAGSVMTKIKNAITALTAKQTTGTDITKIVTGVTQENGKIDVTSVAFNAIADDEINALFN